MRSCTALHGKNAVVWICIGLTCFRWDLVILVGGTLGFFKYYHWVFLCLCLVFLCGRELFLVLLPTRVRTCLRVISVGSTFWIFFWNLWFVDTLRLYQFFSGFWVWQRELAEGLCFVKNECCLWKEVCFQSAIDLEAQCQVLVYGLRSHLCMTQNIFCVTSRLALSYYELGEGLSDDERIFSSS